MAAQGIKVARAAMSNNHERRRAGRCQQIPTNKDMQLLPLLGNGGEQEQSYGITVITR